MYKAQVNYLNESKEVKRKEKRFLFRHNAIKWAREMCWRYCGTAFVYKNGKTVHTIL